MTSHATSPQNLLWITFTLKHRRLRSGPGQSGWVRHLPKNLGNLREFRSLHPASWLLAQLLDPGLVNKMADFCG